jgi:hypothetical protein
MEVLEQIVLRLITKYEIQSYKNKGLKMAITQEKKRRQRGKCMNLLGEKETNGPQCFSPERILAAKAFQESKEAAEQGKKRQEAIDKEQATLKHQQKQVEQQERTIGHQLRQQAAKEEREREKVEPAFAKSDTVSVHIVTVQNDTETLVSYCTVPMCTDLGLLVFFFLEI